MFTQRTLSLLDIFVVCWSLIIHLQNLRDLKPNGTVRVLLGCLGL